MSHSILLIQPSTPETRTYSDYESVNDCLEGVCRIYEEHLKRRNPNTVSSTALFKQVPWQFVANYFLAFAANHNIRHQPAIRLRRSVEGPQRIGVSKVHKHLRSVQQVLDKGEDLRAFAQSCRHHLNPK